MKRPRRKWSRVIAAAAAFILIGLLCYITVSFAGNPLAAAKANHAVKKYIENQYSELDLEVVRKAKFNFKDKTYVSVVQSKTVKDLQFMISTRNGIVQWDNYELNVLEYSNTLMRLSDEYTEKVTKLLHEQVDKRYKEIRAAYSAEQIEKYKDLLELDMPFDAALPIDAYLYVNIDLNEAEKINLQALAEQVTKIYKCLSDNGYPIAKYNLYIKKGEKLVIGNLPVTAVMEEAGILNSIEKAYNNKGEYNGISVIVSGDME
ncbi:hypothetical protein [Paenibacillus sp. GXUN7292]|uniref:YfjL-like protein n=1 Tax=Paenibacillus sp. GXUN7292 TaxID=3422499 RepID=UPI003D7CA4C7